MKPELGSAPIRVIRGQRTSAKSAVHGEPILISRGAKPVARLLPVEEAESLAVEREDWIRAAEQSLSLAYGPDEPDYGSDQIVEPKPPLPAMREGAVVLLALTQADGTVKPSPAVMLRQLPGFGDWLVCGISTQLDAVGI